jgi:carbonic anhydrase
MPCLEQFEPHRPPETLLVACTDPMLDARLLAPLRKEPVLVWRSPGPIVPPLAAAHRDAEAVIDHAVRDLGVKEVAVCGHVPTCVLSRLVRGQGPSPDSWADDDPLQYYALASLKLAEEKRGPVRSDDLPRAVVEEHVLLQLANLRTYPAVAARLDRGELTLHAWIYDAVNDRLYGHSAAQCALLRRLYRSTIPAEGLKPFLEPQEIYLA